MTHFTKKQTTSLALGLIAGALTTLLVFSAPASAHPGHSGHESTPWYRYLPPGAPIPSASTNP